MLHANCYMLIIIFFHDFGTSSSIFILFKIILINPILITSELKNYKKKEGREGRS